MRASDQDTGMTEYQKRKLLKSHFESKVQVCPMAGKRAPELVSGAVSQIFRDAWVQMEHSMTLRAQQEALIDADLQLLMMDMNRAKIAQWSMLKLKLDYLNRLPWSMIAVALFDEQVARQALRCCVDDFETDPRPPPVHHRLTWAWLRPGSALRAEIDRFLAGLPRDELSEQFRQWVATLRFIPVVETTIEEKHSRVSLRVKRGSVAPTKISLSNRLPLMERTIRRDAGAMPEILAAFDKSRTLAAIPQLLDLDMHPMAPYTDEQLASFFNRIKDHI